MTCHSSLAKPSRNTTRLAEILIQLYDEGWQSLNLDQKMSLLIIGGALFQSFCDGLKIEIKEEEKETRRKG